MATTAAREKSLDSLVDPQAHDEPLGPRFEGLQKVVFRGPQGWPRGQGNFFKYFRCESLTFWESGRVPPFMSGPPPLRPRQLEFEGFQNVVFDVPRVDLGGRAISVHISITKVWHSGTPVGSPPLRPVPALGAKAIGVRRAQKSC